MATSAVPIVRVPALGRRLSWALQVASQAPIEHRVPYSGAVLRALERRRVGAAVEHAYAHVPHWRAAMRERKLVPADFRSSSDLAKLPMLERAMLQADPERLISETCPPGERMTVRTGGSSGNPIVVHHDGASVVRNAIYAERARRAHLQAAGRRLRLRRVKFGTPQSTSRNFQQAFSRLSLIPRGIRQQQHQFSMLDPIDLNAERVERLRPDVLTGYGSYVEALVEHLAEHRPAGLPRLVTYGGDGMSERGRRRIGEEMGIPVFSNYSAVEALYIGFECEAHRGHHINSDLCPVRLVDDAGRTVADGESGEVVVSNLLGRGTMILNYRLGDVARWIPGPCPCGRKLPTLSFIEGRVDDWLERADGSTLHPQAVRRLFAAEDRFIRSYRIEQRSPNDFLLLIVAASEGRRELFGRLGDSFREALGPETTVEVRFVEELPRTARGKLRTVISTRARAADASSATPVDGTVELRSARPGDATAILDVMRTANMHRVDSPEMPAFEIERFFVASEGDRIVGAAGWQSLEGDRAKTTLLAVVPEADGRGIGSLLQQARMDAMRAAGKRVVTTNADRPETIAWYRRHFGYRVVGSLEKNGEFGDPGIDRWTTLEADLEGPPPAGDGP